MTEAQNPLTPSPIRLGPFTSNLTTPERALAIGAHPDDIDFGCGATLAKWASRGCEVHVLVCTDGSKGTWDEAADVEELVRIRREEQRQAARALGATGLVGFLDLPDGELDSGPDTRRRVVEFIRRTRPVVVLGHDPWKRYRLHPDHRHAGWLTTDGIVAARDPKFLPDLGLPHHRPETLLLFEADEPDHAEDVSGYVETKCRALTAHVSQFESTMRSADDPELVRFRRRIGDKADVAGRAAGMSQAEVFKLIDDL